MSNLTVDYKRIKNFINELNCKDDTPIPIIGQTLNNCMP